MPLTGCGRVVGRCLGQSPQASTVLILLALLLGSLPKLMAQTGAGTSAAATRKTFGDPQVWQYSPSRTYHVEHYRLALRFDEPRGEVFGDETIRLRPFADGFQVFDLDSSGLTIESVSLAQGGTLRFVSNDPKLTVVLPRAYAAGTTIAVRIVYHGFPRTGLFFINPDATYPNRPREIWSQGESEFNHYWFPCWDHPDDKASSETLITVPNDQVAVSNGSLLGVTHQNGTATYHWLETVPHSSYLISIAVGPFVKYSQTYENKSVDYYVPRYVDQATALRSFSLTPDMIGFYARTFGVDYPYEKYAQVAVHNFTEGGMENVSATTQTEWTLHSPRVEPNVSSQGLVAHELAHQWFGDLVTTRDWANIWLNEGFATFIEALYLQHHNGEDDYRLEIWNDQNSARNEDDHKYRRPIVDRHYVYPEQMFDNTTYPKGGAVLDMMRYVLGDRAFFGALHSYLLAHRVGNVDTPDLMEAIRQTSGQNLDWFFHEWLYMGGYPEYDVHASYDTAQRLETVSVRQTQKVDALTPLFDMPVEFAFYGSNGESRRVKLRVHLSEEELNIPLDFAPRIVDFDPDDRIYKTLKFDKSLEELIAQARTDPSMMSRLWAVSQLGKRATGTHSPAIGVLGDVLQHDRFYGVRAGAADALGGINNDEAKAVLLTGLHDPDSRVRESVARSLGHFQHDTQVYNTLITTLHSDPNYVVEAGAAEALGSLNMPEAVGVLQSVVAANVDEHIVSAALRGLAATKQPAAITTLLNEAKPGVPERIRLTALDSLSDIHDQLKGHEQEVATVIRQALSASFPFIRDSGERLAGDLQLHQFEPQLEAEAEGAPTPDERQTAQDAMDAMQGGEQTSAAAGTPDVEKLNQQLHELQQRVQDLEKRSVRPGTPANTPR